ncbi:MAG: hypothetical protein ACFFG0_04390 [Candidatus Thorarchaeota archaeon]
MAWDKTKPAGSTALSASDDQIRDNWDAIESGTVPYDALKLQTQASAPSNVADYGFLYGKDVSSKVELYWEDEDGDEVQLTAGGNLTWLAKSGSDLTMKLGDASASNKLTITDSGDAEVAYLDSDGKLFATTFDTNVAAAGVTLTATTLAADGTDSNIDINITPKGTGKTALATDVEILGKTYTYSAFETLTATATSTEDLGTVGSNEIWMVYVGSDQSKSNCRALAIIFSSTASAEDQVVHLEQSQVVVSLSSRAIKVQNSGGSTRGLNMTTHRLH